MQNELRDPEPKEGINVVLVNTISPYYLVRYQAPLAINILGRYVDQKVESARVHRVDMQERYESVSLRSEDGVDKTFRETLRQSVAEICNIAQSGPTVVGLSIKWAAVEVAKAIVEGVQAECNGKVLYVLGNIGATFGYKELLKEDPFKNALAVVGEGEEALTRIVERALAQNERFSDASFYRGIPNVAVGNGGEPTVDSRERVNLAQYPSNLIPSDDLYDRAWDVHCIETSRGCPWGKCTFCSVDGQFGGGDNGGWEPFPVATVLGNIRALVDQGVRKIDIKDSEFFGAERAKKGKDSFWQTMGRAREIAQGLKDINATLEDGDKIIIHHLSARVDTVYRSGEDEKNIEREKVYRLLKEAGVEGVYLGIESGSPSQLKRFGKGVTVEENKKALEVLRRLGFEIEVGMIFFDYLANMQELQENVEFIEETELYKTDSRILGSLRVQEGSPYVKLAKNQGILGRKHKDHLGYRCEFLDEDVNDLEWTFIQWEKATIKLIKILTPQLALEVRELDFTLMKELVKYFIDSNGDIHGDGGESIITRFREKRRHLLERIRNDESVRSLNQDNSQLLEEHLLRAEAQNEAKQY